MLVCSLRNPPPQSLSPFGGGLVTLIGAKLEFEYQSKGSRLKVSLAKYGLAPYRRKGPPRSKLIVTVSEIIADQYGTRVTGTFQRCPGALPTVVSARLPTGSSVLWNIE